jgi:hypothetical protein
MAESLMYNGFVEESLKIEGAVLEKCRSIILLSIVTCELYFDVTFCKGGVPQSNEQGKTSTIALN